MSTSTIPSTEAAAITAWRSGTPRSIPTLLVEVQRIDRKRVKVTPEPMTTDLAARLLADGIVWVSVQTGSRGAGFYVGDLLA